MLLVWTAGETCHAALAELKIKRVRFILTYAAQSLQRKGLRKILACRNPNLRRNSHLKDKIKYKFHTPS